MKAVDTTPKLVRLKDFASLLSGYKPSSSTLEIFRSLNFVLLVGPTAAGRNTLINLLSETGNYQSVVSHTTRPPRKNNGVWEENGREYWFETEDAFLEDLEKGNYLEAAIIHNQQVSGIHINELQNASDSNKISVDEVEVDGASHMHNFKPDAHFIFLLPPTFDIWIERLMARGDMDQSELRRRLESAQNEIASALAVDYYWFVVNDEIHEAARIVDKLVRETGKLEDEEQLRGRRHAEQLAIDVKLYLSS